MSTSHYKNYPLKSGVNVQEKMDVVSLKIRSVDLTFKVLVQRVFLVNFNWQLLTETP